MARDPDETIVPRLIDLGSAGSKPYQHHPIRRKRARVTAEQKAVLELQRLTAALNEARKACYHTTFQDMIGPIEWLHKQIVSASVRDSVLPDEDGKYDTTS